jgi:hypothetical protein
MARSDERNSSDEIEITPEMIEAGMEEYATRWIGLRDADDEVASMMLKAAYIAMYRLRPLSEHEAHQTVPCARQSGSRVS